jgi:hypothetical protein
MQRRIVTDLRFQQGRFFRFPDNATKVEEVLRGSEYELHV